MREHGFLDRVVTIAEGPFHFCPQRLLGFQAAGYIVTVRTRAGTHPLMPDELRLRLPTIDEEDEFLRAHLATTPEWPTFLHYYHDGMSLARYLEVLGDQERGVNLLPNHVPETFLFAFKDCSIVGRVTIRHKLDDVLAHDAGHIGYVVVPQLRRRGYATEIRRQALRIARERLGLDRVLVTCDDDNIGSIRTIEKNGGVMENIIARTDRASPKRRYWIDLRSD